MLSSASLTAKLRGKWNTQTIKKNLLENSINEFSKNSKKIFPAMSSKLHRMPIFEWTYQYSSGLGILRGIAFSSSSRRWSNIRSRVLFRDKKKKKRIIYKGKRCNRSKCPHHLPRAYPSFYSMKRWMGLQSIVSYLRLTVRPYPFTVLVGERGTVRLKYHAQEHN